MEKLKFLVSAGPTHEYLDPVRFISNPSTGKMGYAIAEAAIAAGHTCDLVSGPTFLAEISGAKMHKVVSALDMQKKLVELFTSCDVLIMTAAVSDYRPDLFHSQKIHKLQEQTTLNLVRNPDILKSLIPYKTKQIVIGFAAETEEVQKFGTSKLVNKKMELIVANDVSNQNAGFASENLLATLIYADGNIKSEQLYTKSELAKFLILEAERLSLTSRAGYPCQNDNNNVNKP